MLIFCSCLAWFWWLTFQTTYVFHDHLLRAEQTSNHNVHLWIGRTIEGNKHVNLIICYMILGKCANLTQGFNSCQEMGGIYIFYMRFENTSRDGRYVQIMQEFRIFVKWWETCIHLTRCDFTKWIHVISFFRFKLIKF